MEFFELTTTFYTPSAKHYHRLITSEYRRHRRKGIRLIDAIINMKSWGHRYYYMSPVIKEYIRNGLTYRNSWAVHWAIDMLKRDIIEGSPYQPRHSPHPTLKK